MTVRIAVAATLAMLLFAAVASYARAVGRSSSYVIYGCHLYAVDDWLTSDLRLENADPNSAKILSQFSLANGNPTFNVNGTDKTTATHASVNIATNGTPLYTVQGLKWGFANDPYNDGPAPRVPWMNGYLVGDGRHGIVLNTQTCVDYEVYQPVFNGTILSGTDAYVHNLNHPFNDQYANDGGLVTKSGIPLLGTLDIGEDAAMPAIPHIAYMLVPGSDAPGYSYGVGGYVAPATAGTACVSMNGSDCAYELPMGARLRLNRKKYDCDVEVPATTHPQAHKICVQLQTYGAMVMDHDGVGNAYLIQLARSSDGTNPWNNADVSALAGIPLNYWDLMKLGHVHHGRREKRR
jgi:hypothetical protein